MRSLTDELPVAATRPLEVPVPRLERRLDADAWDRLAARVAETTDRTVVLDALAGVADVLGVEFDPDADIVVLQRTFGALHRRAAASHGRA